MRLPVLSFYQNNMAKIYSFINALLLCYLRLPVLPCYPNTMVHSYSLYYSTLLLAVTRATLSPKQYGQRLQFIFNAFLLCYLLLPLLPCYPNNVIKINSFY